MILLALAIGGVVVLYAVLREPQTAIVEALWPKHVIRRRQCSQALEARVRPRSAEMARIADGASSRRMLFVRVGI